jgi:hypothetical protein
MAPAARAALMATLSMGCRLDDINCEEGAGEGCPAMRARKGGILASDGISVLRQLPVEA